MFKKTFLILILISIVFVCTSCKNIDNPFNKDCKELQYEINNLIEEVKSCNSNTDCFLDTSTNLCCPFGCSFIRSHEYDKSQQIVLIEEKIEQYKSNCPECKYKCSSLPSLDDIECKQNRCVDNRN